MKHIFTKAKAAGTDPYIGLLEYRNTPITGMDHSPSQLLMGRRLRSHLPTTCQQLLPKTPDVTSVHDKIRTSHQLSKKHHDNNAIALKPPKADDHVRIQKDNTIWKPAIIVRKHNARSYVVQTADGSTYRRNRRFLMKTNENVIAPQTADCG